MNCFTPLERLRELGDHLGEVTRRVRHAVVEAITETLARLTRDTARRLLRQAEDFAPDDWPPEPPEDIDPWETEDRDHVEPESAEYRPCLPATPESVLRSAASAALGAAVWWLRRQGSPYVALGLGAASAIVTAVGGPCVRASWTLVATATDLLTLDRLTRNPR